MNRLYVLVRLKIPDNTAFTTHQALRSLGFQIDKVERAELYEVQTHLPEDKVKKLWENTDVLANSNKHKVEVYSGLPKDSIIVWDAENGGSGVLNTLHKRFNMTSIAHLRKGVWWNLHTNENIRQCVEGLLYSKHFQEYKII